ncbi:MAG: glycoside hydrolase family 3 N-terminal domain-containing protein [Acidobacteriota bacterium]
MRNLKLRILFNRTFIFFLAVFIFLPLFDSQTTTQANSDEAKWVERTLKSLSLRERIGQMIVVSAVSEFANTSGERFQEIQKQIVENKVGGIIVSWGSVNEIAAMTNEFQRLAKIPLLISSDMERGLRMRSRNGTPFTTAMGVAATGDPNAAYTQGKIVAQEMRAIGVNWLYAPVADINNNADNPVINIRSFGEDPKRVAEFVAAFTRGARDGGALSTAKHFPGHGDTATDSHIGLPTINADRARLDLVELAPFRSAIAAGVDSIMVAHIALPRVAGDEMPATLSPKLSSELLRRDLNFQGIIVTDALGMGAIVKGFPNGAAAVQAIKAGADVALMPPDPKAAIDAIEAAVKNGDITEARINESVRRLLKAKYKLGLAKQRFVDLAAVNRLVERPENVQQATRITEMSMTVLRNKNQMLPLDIESANRTLFVVLAADDDVEEGRAFIPQIQQRSNRAKIIRLDPRATADEYRVAIDEAMKAENVIIAPFVKRAASKGTVALPETQAHFVRRMIDLAKPVAVIAFGSPYLIRQFPNAPVYLVTYAIEENVQIAAARALFGETAIKGHLPVSIPNLFEHGAGLEVGVKKSTAAN